ncbi:MAG: fumarate hydratase [Actinomycetia bacterium]|nr:fumarate hydratase [Actinomycetes bacterium]
MEYDDIIINKVKNTLVKAASTFREDHKKIYIEAISREQNPQAKWVLEQILENSNIASQNKGPLCNDTGIPHVFLEIGKQNCHIGSLFHLIQQGIIEGLRELPGRPMAVMGNDIQRIEQSLGLNEDSGALLPAPIIIKPIDGNLTRLHILMLGGGPEIRSKTYRIFHKHDMSTVINEIVCWGKEEVANLGCTPCVPSIGIGRTHFEATALMIEAMTYGRFNIQSKFEKEITKRINETNVGPLGLTGTTTALATFLKIGPQRASGVRIVCLRLSCCQEPRVADILL